MQGGENGRVVTIDLIETWVRVYPYIEWRAWFLFEFGTMRYSLQQIDLIDMCNIRTRVTYMYNLSLIIFFINVWRKIVFDICLTGIGTALTTILPILFKHCYKYCYSDSRTLWAIRKAGGLAHYNLIQPTISLEMPVPSQGHYGFHSFPVVDWFCLFIYLCVLTFPL